MAELVIKDKGSEIKITDTNFGDQAEKFIKEYFFKEVKDVRKRITKTKLHGILDLVNKIYNKIFHLPNEELTDSQLAEIAYIEVKMAYEFGREENVKKFGEITHLMKLIRQVRANKSKQDFLLYARYIESLIAYFKFYGGE